MGIWLALLRRVRCYGQTMAGEKCYLHGVQCKNKLRDSTQAYSLCSSGKKKFSENSNSYLHFDDVQVRSTYLIIIA